MMNTETQQPTRASAAFALAAAIACVFNTALAWAKDAYAPLNTFMASLTGHHWITHALADCIVFVGLGLIFMNTSVANKTDPKRLVSILTWAVVAASLGLFAWYLLF
ncbi:MAG TPA: hypothetical protein VKV15_10380 [Bryobacteraceae bacterium]|nr:hypothetical protein [Bryobacteraceae bacterium]